MNFLAVPGSLRKASTNRVLLEALKRHAPAGVEIELADDLAGLPLFSPDCEGDATPARVLAFAEKVGAADGLVIAAPEYAHGIPGALKNGLDWLVSRFEIPGKPVMLAHATARGLFVREQLSEVLRTMSTRLYPGPLFELHLIGRQAEEAAALLDGDGNPERIRQVLAGFAAFVAAEPAQRRD